MTTYMTHIDFTDVYAKVPDSDDGIGAWVPLTQGQRMGEECIDCGARVRRPRGGQLRGRAAVCVRGLLSAAPVRPHRLLPAAVVSGCWSCGGFGNHHDPVVHGTEPEPSGGPWHCICGARRELVGLGPRKVVGQRYAAQTRRGGRDEPRPPLPPERAGDEDESR